MALVLLVTVICYLCVVFILVSKDIQCFVLSELQLHLLKVLIGNSSTAVLANVADLYVYKLHVFEFNYQITVLLHIIHSIIAILYVAVQSVCEHTASNEV